MDIKLYYQDRGIGKPLVLLHGNGLDSNYFKAQIDYFSKQYRVIAVDTRGHGRSPRGDEPFVFDQFVEDLNYLLKELNLNKIILLGFSDGANIAMMFAIKYSGKLEALILDGGNLNPQGMKWWFQVLVEIRFRMARDKKRRELLNLMVNEPNIELSDLTKIKVPTLVIVGTRDIVKLSHTKVIASNIANAELLIIKGTHRVAKQRPDVFNQKVEEFLNKNKFTQ